MRRPHLILVIRATGAPQNRTSTDSGECAGTGQPLPSPWMALLPVPVTARLGRPSRSAASARRPPFRSLPRRCRQAQAALTGGGGVARGHAPLLRVPVRTVSRSRDQVVQGLTIAVSPRRAARRSPGRARQVSSANRAPTIGRWVQAALSHPRFGSCARRRATGHRDRGGPPIADLAISPDGWCR